MERGELVELLSPTGLALLDSLPPYTDAADVVRMVSDLRKAGHSPGLVAAVLTQSKLRAKAVSKFGEFASRMLFTQAGLEQATRLRVAALHAGRFLGAGIGRVADLGCGIGGDAMSMAALNIQVEAVEADEVTAAIASYNLAPFAGTTVVHSDARDADLSGVDGFWFDPARRTSGHSNTTRLNRPDEYSPPLEWVFEMASRVPSGVKLGPGHDREQLPPDAEAQWVSVDGQLVEMALWFGPLARAGVRRSALLLTADGVRELSAEADSQDAPTGEIGEYLYEPDGSVIRARLIGDLARSIDARMLDNSIAYLTTDRLILTPFATAFRVLERLPTDERKLRSALLERKIGTLEIKKRGVDVDPAALRTRLRLKGTKSGTLLLTRVGGKHITLLVERIVPEQ
ncbi:class I SAM-dependent methyltransferase [Glaciibacter superstes]|uniref:class I SAM-dependent methyltransferase n=1 Tax=Glaciibacter superstes TaxID=501023 RepID=UPI0003B6228B|nr:class I SAM-dependent methyltransferase [Glaciibacter superstes]